MLATLHTAQPCIDSSLACRDTVILQALVSEIGNGGALNHKLALHVRRTARGLAKRSPCPEVRYRAEELAFDMTDWLEHENDDSGN